MNKPVKPEQLDLAEPLEAGEVRRPPLREAPTRDVTTRTETDRFDWFEDADSIVLQEQPATAVYYGGGGHLVIRQTNGLEDDVTLLIAPHNITAFLEGAAKRARET